MFEQDHTEENEQQKSDEARGGQDESFEEDSDYLSFKSFQDRVLGSEYGGEISRNDTMDDDGTYKFDTGDDDELNLEEIYKKREKIYTYYRFKDVIDGMEPDGVFPHLQDLEASGLMNNLVRREKNRVFLGLDFKKDGGRHYIHYSFDEGIKMGS